MTRLIITALAGAALFFSGAAMGAAVFPDLARLATVVAKRLQDERILSGTPRLAREQALDRAALEIAREVASRDPKQRLRGSLRALERAQAAGAEPLSGLESRVFLMRGSTTPADEVVRQWRIARDSWELFLAPETLRYGLGASRSSDGWIVVVALVARPADEVAPSEPPQAPTPEEARTMEMRIHAMVLEERRRRGLSPLVRDGELDTVARLYSFELAQAGRISHRGPDGSDVTERLARRGIAFSRASENLAQIRSEDVASRALRGWLESPGHRANLLDPRVTHAGVGVAWSADGTFFITQVFTKPRRGLR